ncbi:diiron oxygenase [Cupriavidus alkaliphilus]|uniref:diiron oxygenase n=1 Tax=Cupriavidus alkaliphilus TaxID=942866 RepID=UPI000DC3E9ED|nr:diiron oxygenase [Cupriavidus alkaliphilus]RAS01784.1 para-aminobenzoate N-oxygenase AurF [Cupriavidus alkaliphilus]
MTRDFEKLSCFEASIWFKRATVRTAAPISLAPGDVHDWRFPSELNPLLSHPSVLALPAAARRYLAVQYSYKYMHDICLTETDIINRTSLAIAYGDSACAFPPDICTNAFSIVVDEAFHSYAARLFALELEKASGIEPVHMPASNALMRAIALTKVEYDGYFHPEIELLATCISESAFTSEIVDALQIKMCDPRFHRLMKDHLADEGRHYGYFQAVLSHFGVRAEDRQRQAAGPIATSLLQYLFQHEQESVFDLQLLESVGLGRNEAIEVQRQTPQSRSAMLREERARHFLESSGLFD